MPKPFPLQTVRDLSQMRLEEATRRLGELISGQQQATQRLELLIQYREEYQARFVAAMRDGIGPDVCNNYRAFIVRLDDAVKQAEAMVAASTQRTAAGQRAWIEKSGQVKAFDTLAQRHQAREDRLDQRREQKALDEHAARSHADKEAEG